MIRLLLAFMLTLACIPVMSETSQAAKSGETSVESPPNQPVNEFSDWEIEVSGKAYYAWRLGGDSLEQRLREEVEKSIEACPDIPAGLRCIVGYRCIGRRLKKFELIRSSEIARFDQLVLETFQKQLLEDAKAVENLRLEGRAGSHLRAVELCSGKLSRQDSDYWWPWQRKIIEGLDYRVRLAMPSERQSVPSQRCIASFVVASDGKIEYIGSACYVRNPEFLSIVQKEIEKLQGDKLLRFPEGAKDKFRLISTEVYFRPLHPYKERPIVPIGDFGN